MAAEALRRLEEALQGVVDEYGDDPRFKEIVALGEGLRERLGEVASKPEEKASPGRREAMEAGKRDEEGPPRELLPKEGEEEGPPKSFAEARERATGRLEAQKKAPPFGRDKETPPEPPAEQGEDRKGEPPFGKPEDEESSDQARDQRRKRRRVTA